MVVTMVASRAVLLACCLADKLGAKMEAWKVAKMVALKVVWSVVLLVGNGEI